MRLGFNKDSPLTRARALFVQINHVPLLKEPQTSDTKIKPRVKARAKAEGMTNMELLAKLLSKKYN